MTRLCRLLLIGTASMVPTGVLGQSASDPQTATAAQAAVAASVVTVTATQALGFGTGAAGDGLLPGSTYTVNVSTGAGGTRGRATIDHNTSVNVTMSVSQALQNTNLGLGAADIPFSITCAEGNATLTTVNTTGWGGCAKSVEIKNGKKTTTFLVVGGSVTIPADQAAGTYTGGVLVSAAFTRN